MDKQHPSKRALAASCVFFVALGVLTSAMGISSLGDDPDSKWLVIGGFITVILSFGVTYYVLVSVDKNAEQGKSSISKGHEGAVNVRKAQSSSHLVRNSIVALVLVIMSFKLASTMWNFTSDKLRKDTYIAFFYYDPSNLNAYWQAPVGSIEDCRNWVNLQIERDYDGAYDYECGVNCLYDNGFQGYICEKTVE